MHLGKDKIQLVNATLFDYSNLSSVKLYHNVTVITAISSANNTYVWNISNLSSGNSSFTIEAIDNYNLTHAKNYTYNFTVTSCSDGVKNGDEAAIDCGGSCSVCITNTTDVTASATTTESTTTTDTSSATAPETTQTVEETVVTSTAPVTASGTAAQASATPVNWTTGLKESKTSKRETALYVLGGILIFLLAIYALIVMRR